MNLTLIITFFAKEKNARHLFQIKIYHSNSEDLIQDFKSLMKEFSKTCFKEKKSGKFISFEKLEIFLNNKNVSRILPKAKLKKKNEINIEYLIHFCWINIKYTIY